MKRVKAILATALALIIVACGFFLPEIVSDYTDRASGAEVTTLDAAVGQGSSSIALREKLTDGVKSFSVTTTKVQVTSGTALSAEEAGTLALNFLTALTDTGFFDSGYAIYNNEAFYVTYSSGFAVWECSFKGANGDSGTLMFDDETGCLLSMYYQFSAATLERYGDSGWGNQMLIISDWMINEYAGKTGAVNYAGGSTDASIDDEKNIDGVYDINLNDEKTGETFTLSLRHYAETIYFNQ